MNSDIVPGNGGVRQPPAAMQSSVSSTSLEQASALEEQTPLDTEGQAVEYQPPKRRGISWRRLGGFAAIIIGVALGALLLYHNAASRQQAKLQAQLNTGSQRIKQQTLPLPDLSQELLSRATNEPNASLIVNGQIKVNSSLVLQPSTAPSNPVAGEMYYDLPHAQLDYYNGTQFVPVTPGGTTTINNITNGAKTTNITNVTNNIGSSGNLSGVSGTPGSIAMFTDPTTLGDSFISQNGNNLSTGSGLENVTIGSQDTTSATTLQAGLGNVLLTTGAQNGTTGGITIQSGDSSTTASGNISIDTGNSVINGTLVGSKDFENGTDNMGDGIFGDNSVITQSSAQAHSGTHSLSIAVGSNFFPSWATAAGEPFQEIPVTQGHTYAFSAWVRADTNSDLVTAFANWSTNGFGGGGFISQASYGNTTDINTGWRHIAGVLTAPAGANFVGIGFSSFNATSVGEIHYIDNITVTDLSSGGSSASINIGATNAQLINIGNSGMLSATSIYGSGITLGAGAGILNESAATIAATSGGATYQTTSGALDITAATSSTWKIAGSPGFGGSLAIESGNAGGNGNGGDITLQAGLGSGTGVSGSITLDGQFSNVSGTVIDDRGFETGTQNMLAVSGNTVAQSNTAVHSGNFSLAITPSGGNWVVQQDEAQPGIPVVAGNQYFFSAYVRANALPADVTGKIDFVNGSNAVVATDYVNKLTTTTSWAEISGTLTAPATSVNAYWIFDGSSGAGDIQYLDDLVTTDLSTSTATPSLNLGNLFTQAVSLGNMNEVGPTTIQGGSGININAGTATVNLTGGVITINGLSTVVKPQTDSTSAFEVQNASGAPLVTADTSNMTLTVAGNLAVNAHIISGGTAISTTSEGSATACSGGGLWGATGNDISGTVSITAGTAPCNTVGALINVGFVNNYASAPHVLLTPAESNASTLQYYVTTSPSGFTVNTNTANLVSGQQYNFYYLVVQ